MSIPLRVDLTVALQNRSTEIKEAMITSVMRQKSESQKGHYKKTKKFSKKRILLTPWYTHVPVRIRG